MKTWLTVAEGARHFGASRDTIYIPGERAELRHTRIGRRRAAHLKPEWVERLAGAAHERPRGIHDHERSLTA